MKMQTNRYKISGMRQVLVTPAVFLTNNEHARFDMADRSIPALCKVDGCLGVARSKGMCSAHYNRWLRHGDPTKGDAHQGEGLRWINDHAAYAGDDCIAWPFGKKSRRYGAVKFRGAMRTASRVMCIIAHGDPPYAEMQAAHSCGNGHLLCMNPRHLSWKTSKDNYQDAVNHGSSTRGERVGSAKLTELEVRKIKAIGRSIPQAAVAEMFGVDRTCISLILRGKNWAWVE